jgi:hypothetical protein
MCPTLCFLLPIVSPLLWNRCFALAFFSQLLYPLLFSLLFPRCCALKLPALLYLSIYPPEAFIFPPHRGLRFGPLRERGDAIGSFKQMFKRAWGLPARGNRLLRPCTLLAAALYSLLRRRTLPADEPLKFAHCIVSFLYSLIRPNISLATSTPNFTAVSRSLP